MPRAKTAEKPPADFSDHVAVLVAEAAGFVAPDRALGMIRKWMRSQDVQHLSDDEAMVVAADAATLAADLLLSQPASSGATAFDRLAKRHAGAVDPAQAAALQALCKARFRLLRVERGGKGGGFPVRDVLSGEMLQVLDRDIPPLPPGTPLFARVVLQGEGVCALAGAVTPLDDAAFDVAHGFLGRDARGPVGAARWAEAVFAHVSRHGTLGVPGLNRPHDSWEDDQPFDAETRKLMDLTTDWSVLGDGTPSPDLVQRTREVATLGFVVSALQAAALARTADSEIGVALERMSLVMLDKARNRTGIGTSTVTLDAVRQAVEKGIADKSLPSDTSTMFDELCSRLAAGGGGAARQADNPELERLLQRIRALRAKTVAQGCTEAEALAAAEKVAELLDRYGLSLGELEWQAQPCEGIGIQTGRKRFAAIDNCIPAIAEYFGCRVWVEQAKGETLRYVFFGLRGDVAAAEYLYELVERAFETETQAFRAGPIYAGMGGERRSATTSFQTGLAHGIAQKLQAMRAAREATQRSASGRDLVPVKAAVVDEELAKLGLALQGRAVGGRKRVLTDAFEAGQEAGERFEVTSAIARAA